MLNNKKYFIEQLLVAHNFDQWTVYEIGCAHIHTTNVKWRIWVYPLSNHTHISTCGGHMCRYGEYFFFYSNEIFITFTSIINNMFFFLSSTLIDAEHTKTSYLGDHRIKLKKRNVFFCQFEILGKADAQILFFFYSIRRTNSNWLKAKFSKQKISPEQIHTCFTRSMCRLQCRFSRPENEK